MLAALALLLAAIVVGGSTAGAATPAAGTLSPDAAGKGEVKWTGTAGSTPTTAGGSTDDCFGADKKPDATSGCDFYKLDVTVPDAFYSGFIGGVQITADGFGQCDPASGNCAGPDLDLGIYHRNADDSRGDRAGGSGAFPGHPEKATLPSATGAYYVVLVPYAAPPGTSYNGKAEFLLKKANPSLTELNANTALLGPENFRASHDKYISHSEPTLAMDPLNHDHLVGGSKMYENLPRYLFKIGTYESFDGGLTWTDYGHLPGYCEKDGKPYAPYCDINSKEYRVSSDISIAFDDEGNAYGNVLDAIGGATSTGWNLNVHIKKPGKPWGPPIVAHDNRSNPISNQTFLDDKNWISVDNYTLPDGSPNKPRDGKVGTIYVCWSYDESQVGLGQTIALVKSDDGGKSWGGFAPGDNTPRPLSQKGAVSGIGCHPAIGPKGEVYISWYDNQVDAVMQVKSTDHGKTWTPQRPVAQITGVNSAFEGQAFRNLSIPSTAVDKKGNVYIVVQSQNGSGSGVPASGQMQKPSAGEPAADQLAAGDGAGPKSGSDIVLFKSTDGGSTYTGPVRVNQDAKNGDADQFQPWLAVTDSGQLDVSYFDRRNDPNNFFIQTYLSRSNDGGKTWTDSKVGHMLWDPHLNPPVSGSGLFIGDYQGLVADDDVAIPFWNDTQYANLPATDPAYSQWQEVSAARISNARAQGGPGPVGAPPESAVLGSKKGRSCLAARLKVGSRGVGRLKLRQKQEKLRRIAGTATVQRKLAWRYCVGDGKHGSLAVAFSPSLDVRLILTTAPGHAAGKIHRGSTVKQMRRVYRDAKGMPHRTWFVSKSRGLVFGVRRGKIAFIAVADKRLIKDRGQLQVYMERLGIKR
jgi:hypothetical protein